MAALNRVHTADHETEAPRAVPEFGARDEEFLDEGRRLLDRACTGDQRERGQVAIMADDLLDRARHVLLAGDLGAASFARILRAGALVRNMARLPDLPPDPLVYDLVVHTIKHGLPAHNAAAQALRGTLAISRGLVDDALDAAVDAMATIELIEEHNVERALAVCDAAGLLDQLGVSEVACELYGQAAAEFSAVGMHGYQIMMISDQVRCELLHGLWMERLGQPVAAVERFTTAGRLALDGLRLWEDAGPTVRLDKDFAASFYAALALADPDGDHEAALRQASERIALPGQIVAGLALTRLLARAGRGGEANELLSGLRAAGQQLQVGMPLRLALARGVLEPPRPDHNGSAVAGYLRTIEDELWTMRTARTRALHARLEHERLRRGRTPLRALTNRDPVTALPDRTVLDDVLLAATGPSAMAMVDVDDLVAVNQGESYADGDAVLRAVAVTVRSAVGRDDTVFRYSSDDFVVVMPGRTPDQAAEVMRGVVDAVAALPRDRGHGSTVSIGVISVEPGECPESSLIRADDATREAKDDGGNRVTMLADEE